MKPVLYPSEMAEVDANANVPLEVLIGRAGWALAQRARAMLSARPIGADLFGAPRSVSSAGPAGAFSVSGRRVAVIAGGGNNGNDGRVCAQILSSDGALCDIYAPAGPPRPNVSYDLVIDAAFGTGFRGEYFADDRFAELGVPILAVDVPSGVDAASGELSGSPLVAETTVSFGAYKPGQLFDPGRRFCGEIDLAPIGLDCDHADIWLLESSDLGRWPNRPTRTHKWNEAVLIIGGSPGMEGAAGLCARAALRSGASYVGVASPHATSGAPSSASQHLPVEAVRIHGGDGPRFWSTMLEVAERFAAVVIGPGLDVSGEDSSGSAAKASEIARFVDKTETAVVLDASALSVIGEQGVVWSRSTTLPAPVLTPHAGEFAKLAGRRSRSSAAKIDDAAELARRFQSVVLLKGPTTVVAANRATPDGCIWISVAGDQRLATAGTGDVLSGLIAAALARGIDPHLAASLAAILHGSSVRGGRSIVAGDLPDLCGRFLDAAVR